MWAQHDRQTTFLLEYDTGSEHLPQLTAKLGNYGKLAQAMAGTECICPLLLFCFPTPRREQAARRALVACYDAPALRIATTAIDPEHTSPAGPVWLPLRRTGDTSGQVALCALDAALPDPWRVTRDGHAGAPGHARRHAELDALATKIRTKQQAIDRYHAAFENGTMDDTTAGPRLRDLHDQIAQLTACRDELADIVASQPQPPPPALIGHLASYLHHILDAGAPADRKAAVEALIHQIRVTPEGLIPVSRIPQPGTAIPGEPAVTGSQVPVRTMDSSVGLTCQHPNPPSGVFVVSGPELTIRPIGTRRAGGVPFRPGHGR